MSTKNELEWRDIRADKTEVDVCHEEARLGAHTARIYAPDRRCHGKEYSVDIGGVDSFHRSPDLARKNAEKRLREASAKDASTSA